MAFSSDTLQSKKEENTSRQGKLDFTFPGKTHHIFTYFTIISDFLLKKGKPVSSFEIKEKTGIDLDSFENGKLNRFLLKNKQITFQNGFYSYNPKYILNKKDDLFVLLKNNYLKQSYGLDLSLIQHECPEIYNFANSLVSENKIIILKTGKDFKITVAFYEQYEYIVKEVSPVLKQKWHDQIVPESLNIKNELEKVGLKSMSAFNKHSFVIKKNIKKPSVSKKRRFKITNVHLPYLNVKNEIEKNN